MFMNHIFTVTVSVDVRDGNGVSSVTLTMNYNKDVNLIMLLMFVSMEMEIIYEVYPCSAGFCHVPYVQCSCSAHVNGYTEEF